MKMSCNIFSNTPPKFNLTPEKWWLEDYFPIGKVIFHELWGGKGVICWIYWEGDGTSFFLSFSSKSSLPIDLWEIGMLFPPTWSVALHLRGEKLPSY